MRRARRSPSFSCTCGMYLSENVPVGSKPEMDPPRTTGEDWTLTGSVCAGRPCPDLPRYEDHHVREWSFTTLSRNHVTNAPYYLGCWLECLDRWRFFLRNVCHQSCRRLSPLPIRSECRHWLDKVAHDEGAHATVNMHRCLPERCPTVHRALVSTTSYRHAHACGCLSCLLWRGPIV